jgi:hypothetical protein
VIVYDPCLELLVDVCSFLKAFVVIVYCLVIFAFSLSLLFYSDLHIYIVYFESASQLLVVWSDGK